jgi:amino-acid N-acetyltransferase
VAESTQGDLVGACALHVCWEGLGEIRSLAVIEPQRGGGLGARLLELCVNEARELGLDRLFVLTYIPDYFEKQGFVPIEKSQLPHKIWADCIKCVNFPECGEEALERRL